MMRGVTAFTNDAKSVVFHDRSAADSTEQTLLHPTLETKNCYFRRWLGASMSFFRQDGRGTTYNLDLYRDLSKSDPWDKNTASC
jgi:hypothetical protein